MRGFLLSAVIRIIFLLIFTHVLFIQAAIVASKVEVEPRRKRPRSKFAADKLRSTRTRGEVKTRPFVSQPSDDWWRPSGHSSRDA